MNSPLIWAHRGASAYAPENTLRAFQKAVDMRADGIELDVQMTKDGYLVVIHDETVDRVSDGKGWVRDLTYRELLKLNVNKKFPELGRINIPTLEEVYLLVKDSNLTVNVELKNGIVFYEQLENKVMELAAVTGMEERVIYSSFNHFSVMKLKELNPSVRTGFLYGDGYLDMPEYAQKHHVDALHPAFYNLQYPGFIPECKQRGIQLRVWTVNREEDMVRLCEAGVDVIITNFPDIGRKVVDAYAGEKCIG
ncbi:glycerophosphodiester phosphodiesterase [Parasporobacterium paucivorans]|uniref:Glycerophosphoryl diester phosphodiesterase n=1 Tax=Parasporobacterium paucivorans DSM 15970 TaxID=1122934 RepID=A0A1M6LH70_9FIRM|nr:glycerophosphodiester phosphodiesterase [Parasporobacterium paucivorans]SHJ70527.1 glycerophosphoryl diester phosphodiesterase [Parasporobacterium paucivorans DSM 15970]